MKKEELEMIKYLVKKELKEIEETEEEIPFPSLEFLTSIEIYEKRLKDLLKKL